MSDQTPGADDLGFDLVPPDDDLISPEDQMNAAATAALEDPTAPVAVATEPPEPLGISWLFDFDAGHFIRQGAAPARVTGTDALEMWCLTALSSARFAHAVFSDEFGMENPAADLGAAVAAEVAVDFAARIRDALLVHDRISDVADITTNFDPTTGIVFTSFTVVTDEEESVPIDDLQISTTTTGA